jgi:hypothetical protein
MNKIICVYQDCPLCGNRGKKLKKIIETKRLDVKKVSFASPEGKELCSEAIFKHGIKTMPFFTDGKKFADTLEELLAKPKKTTKKTRKTIKKKEVEDEFDS